MGVKHSFKQILTLMTGKQTCIRSMSVLMAVVLSLQLAVMPVKATGWLAPTEQEVISAPLMPENGDTAEKPVLLNTYALVVATGGQPGDAIQYFKVIYEDADGIRRSEYIFREDNRASFERAQAQFTMAATVLTVSTLSTASTSTAFLRKFPTFLTSTLTLPMAQLQSTLQSIRQTST